MNEYPKRSKVIYGLGGPEQAYRSLRYQVVGGRDDTVGDYKYWALKLRLENPDIKEVYLIDNGPTLRHEYNLAWKTNTIASYYQFRDTLQTEGIRLL